MRNIVRSRWGLVALLSALSASAAQAQPAREDNIYNGMDHQPTRDEMAKKEKGDGMAPAKTGTNSELEKLDRKLLHDEAVSPPGADTPPAPVR